MFKNIFPQMEKSIFYIMVMMLLSLLVACGGDGGSSSFSGDGSDDDATATDQTLNAVASPSTVPADGVTTSQITLTLVDSNSEGVSDAVILIDQESGFVLDATGVSLTQVTTDSDGQAIVFFLAESTDEDVTVNISFELSSDSSVTTDETISVTALPQPSDLNINASPATISADGISASQITATLTDSSGAAVANEVLNVGFDSSDLTIQGTITDASGATVTQVTTDANGQASVFYIADLGSAAGTDTINFTLASNSSVSEIILVNIEALSVGSITLTSAVITGGDVALNITVNAVADGGSLVPVEGESILLEAIEGIVNDGTQDVVCANSAAVTFSPSTTTSDENGFADALFDATSSGDYCVRATASSSGEFVEAVVNFTLSSIQTRLSLSTDKVAIGTGNDAIDDIAVVTALVTNENNNLLSGEQVTFSVVDPNGVLSTSQGIIQVVNDITDSSGQASINLSTIQNPLEQTVRVVATLDSGDSAFIDILVDGNVLNINPDLPNILQDSQTETFIVSLENSAGTGIPNAEITVQTSDANVIQINGQTEDSVTLTTDLLGQAPSFTLTGISAGTAIISIFSPYDSPDGNFDNSVASITNTIDVSNIIFTVSFPGSEVSVNSDGNFQADINTPVDVLVTWTEGSAVAGEEVQVSTTRGNLDDPATTAIEQTSVLNLTTDSNGQVNVTLESSSAGTAVISALGIGTPELADDEKPSDSESLLFVAVQPQILILEADPTTLGTSATQGNNQSQITAKVFDVAGNPVKDQVVSFTLTDTTGGSLSSGSKVTNENGIASITYTAGATASAKDGVLIEAEIVGTNITDDLTLTVTDESLFVRLGFPGVVEEPSETVFNLPLTVTVTDAAGNGVGNQEVELLVSPVTRLDGTGTIQPAYYKGRYYNVYDSAGTYLGRNQDIWASCPNEDIDLDGVLDPGEDVNNNGILDPGNVASLPDTIFTSSDTSGTYPPIGLQDFNMSYFQDHATWLDVKLEAVAKSSGSEAKDTANFNLPIAAEQINESSESEPIPAFYSPFGVYPSCFCDTIVVNNCPDLDAQIILSIPDEDSTVSGTQVTSNQTTFLNISLGIIGDADADGIDEFIPAQGDVFINISSGNGFFTIGSSSFTSGTISVNEVASISYTPGTLSSETITVQENDVFFDSGLDSITVDVQ